HQRNGISSIGLLHKPWEDTLKLRKNNWDTDTFEFDEVLTEFASQKRVYKAVAQPVVEALRLWDDSIIEKTRCDEDNQRRHL
ncbi:armadillo repeat-containing kinesin-like protein 3, partial [Tanacetum coccineum]